MERDNFDSKAAQISKSIFSYCMARTSNEYEAEDLAQDILLELTKSVHNIREDKAFYGFMWSVAKNVYKQWYRRKKLRQQECELTDDISNAENEIGNLFDDNSEIYILRRELSLLSKKYRRATILYYLENKSCSEISKLLSISESMVKYLLFKSRKILKDGLNMERNYGEQSYNPKRLNLMYMGEGPNKYWELIDGNIIRQNILWACYNDSLTEEEISLQIGVALPYIENDIKILTDVWLLKKEGRHYRTNIIILTSDFETEKSTKLLPLQKKIAESIESFILQNEEKIKGVGFTGHDMSLSSLKWHMATMFLLNAYEKAEGNYFTNTQRPLTAFGEHAYLWGAEDIRGGFNCCTIRAEEWHTGISMFFMDWYSRTNQHHRDFYNNKNWVKLYDKICHGNTLKFNEFEQEIAAEMVKKGYVIIRGGDLFPAMPVYSEKQYQNMIDLQKPVVTEIENIFLKMHEIIAAILTNHVPTQLKNSVREISAMSLFHDGTYVPASLLVQNGFLSTNWTPGEIATSYAVIK